MMLILERAQHIYVYAKKTMQGRLKGKTMDYNGKMENLLNLALEATPEEREKSLELDVGYEPEENTWEAIIKYSGELEVFYNAIQALSPDGRIQIVNLSNEYMILVVPQELLERVANLPLVEYMEKPKRLFFAVNNGKRVSCINPLQAAVTGNVPDNGRNHLTGAGVLMGIVDSGIDYAHPDFRKADGKTRILSLWDQSIKSGTVRNTTDEGENDSFLSSPPGFFLGTEFSEEVINRALEQPTQQLRQEVCPSRDTSGHGTHVAGIAAGNGRASEGRYRGVAFESSLIVVKLGNARADGFPRTTELMQAVDYCIRKAAEYAMPLVINLSFGNNYGSHSGTSLIETFLDDMASYGKTSIVIGSGNEGASAVHTSGRLEDGQLKRVELAVSEYESTLSLQLWKSYADEVAVSIQSPTGRVVGPIQRIQGAQRFTLGGTQLLFYYGEPNPYNPYQEIYFEFIPLQNYLDGGIWEIQLLPQRVVDGRYDMWLPAGGVLNTGTGFLFPTPETTLTIPSTAQRAITVAAYDAYFDQLAAFSGRGYTWGTNQVKPDLAAPGVDINSCAPGGGYTVRTGTSMATPFVSGGAALLMQWGIVNGNDAYLYGEKMKAYLIKGARELPVITEYPNSQIGAYGNIVSS